LLEGLKVVDLAGPAIAYTGRMLVDLGADVVLVEPPGGSRARRLAPLAETPSGGTVSAQFAYMAAGKRSVTLDLADPENDAQLRLLLGWADVLLVTPDDSDPLPDGFDPEDLIAAHPRLIITVLTPFGLRGPRRTWHGSDLTGWAAGGVLPFVGDPDRAPLSPAGGLAYATAATNAAMATVLALRTRTTTGRGQLVDLSLQEAVISVGLEAGPYMMMETVTVPHERTGMRRATPPIGQYRTIDGAVSIVGYQPWQWDALASWIADETGNDVITLNTFGGTPAARAPYVEAIDTWIEALTTRYTKQEFFVEAQRRGIPVAPVNSIADLVADPHLEATHAWRFVDDPESGSIRYPRPPIRIDGEAGGVGNVPAPGEHTAAVLGEAARTARQHPGGGGS
jgi:crotonobetainyl-CoA:carnitine CoA-transferase CaiB-like acyl-CoA transferase